MAGDTSSQIVIINRCDNRDENRSIFRGFPLSFFDTISETKCVRFELFFSVTGTWYIPPGGHPLVPPPAHQFANTLNLSNPHCDRLSFRNSRHTPYSYQRRSPPGMTASFLYPPMTTLSGNAGKFGHQVNSDTYLQTVTIQMRRLLMSRLIGIFIVAS